MIAVETIGETEAENKPNTLHKNANKRTLLLFDFRRVSTESRYLPKHPSILFLYKKNWPEKNRILAYFRQRQV